MINAKSTIIFATVMICAAGWSYERAKNLAEIGDLPISSIQTGPPCIKLYDHLVTYSEQYRVPLHIAVGVAKKETGYGGPFHWKYDPKQTSYANAYGAMQIQAPTASDVWDRKVTSKQLLNDLEFNVHTSMKLLALLHKRYGSWEIALGCYNTGRPIVNDYARKIVNGN